MTVGLQTFLKVGLLFVFLSSTLVVSATEVGVERKRLRIGLFSAGDLTDWQTKVFSGKTRYQLVSDPEDSLVQVLKSTSHSSASGLVKKYRVDLNKTPFLQWRWRVAQPVQTNNEREKRQDDYAARIYVIVDGGFFAWNSIAINYVWAHGVESGSRWGNAFAPNNAKMIALRSKGDNLNQWYVEKRDVSKDFNDLYGKRVRYIDVIAIMTDTDNTQSNAESYYGDIYFSSH